MGDGAYDGGPVSNAVLDKQPDAKIIIPPHKTAICSAAGDSQRDEHIRTIEQKGRIFWQKKTCYGLRSYVELAIKRCKRIFGITLKARELPQQKKSVDHCVRAKQNDQSRDAGVSKSLEKNRKWGCFFIIPINSTTPEIHTIVSTALLLVYNSDRETC